MASLTSLERDDMFKGKAFLSPDEAAEVRAHERCSRSSRAKTRSRPTPSVKAKAGTDPGGYNAFWLDPGTKLAVVNGEARTSFIVDPADGKVPYSACRTQGVRRARAGDQLRRTRESCARRALPARLRLHQRPADAAGRLQQQLSDRADAGCGDDPGRDGARRTHRAHERQAPARATSRPGWAIPSVTGKATRWWSKRPTCIPVRRRTTASSSASICRRPAR